MAAQTRPWLQRQAVPPTLTSVGYMSGARTLCAGPADALTGLARYREVYRRARQRWGVRVSLRFCWYSFRYGVCLSGSALSVAPPVTAGPGSEEHT